MDMLTFGVVPTAGSLFGTLAPMELLSQINMDLSNSGFFNSIDDRLSECRQAFITNVVEPVRTIGNTALNIIGSVLGGNRIIPITEEDMLRTIPTCMHMPILQYAPMKKLFDQGRIFGFGYDFVPEEDPYGRLINNGTCEDVLASLDENDEITLTWEWRSDDPDLSFEEIDAIEETRNFIDRFLAESNMDPTDYGNLRG